MKSLRVALCQINPTVGDLKGNAARITEFYKKALVFEPDLAVFPELALTGYPPEDLVLREGFLQETQCYLDKIASEVEEAACIVGFVQSKRKGIFNSAAVLKSGKISALYSKHSLPNYGVFDEKRYFVPGSDLGLVRIKGIPVGLSICEDIWENDPILSPCIRQAKKGARILINISASPFHAGKLDLRARLLKKRTEQTGCHVVYVNMAGGQDELVFDGRSLVMDEKGDCVVLAKSFEEDIKIADFNLKGKRLTAVDRMDREYLPAGSEEIYKALVLGTKDYVEKNNFKNVVVGLSGGIDSALTACVAVDALGKDRVLGLTLPSKYSSVATRKDARETAARLGIRFLSVPIQPVFEAFLKALAPHFKGARPGVAEENLQSSIRGTLLMAFSNKFGHLVLTTGNKSEVSVGYSTLYGDTAGGFAVLKDVPKTVVYLLSEYVNEKSGREIIPRSVLRRAPSAELKPNQKDQDTLPPYDLLDRIIKGYVEEDKGFNQLLKEKFKRPVLEKVIKMIDLNEYKRRQTPPGIKITPKSFGRDRRMPITNRFTEF